MDFEATKKQIEEIYSKIANTAKQLDDEISELHCENVKKAVYSLGDSDDEESEDYIGYIDISKKEDKIFVFQDLGGSFDCEEKVHKLLNALNSVEGISKVLINE